MAMAAAGHWRLKSGAAGFRIERVRALGSETFTWAQLLDYQLQKVQVFVLYFPSRFDLPVDAAATEALRVFGQNTAAKTSVNFWDPRDDHFEEALALFDVESPPALVLTTGRLGTAEPAGDAPADDLYSITFTGEEVLADRKNMAAAVNVAHEILLRCDRGEITGYIRARKVRSILDVVAKVAGGVRDQILKLHPKFCLPGGASFELS